MGIEFTYLERDYMDVTAGAPFGEEAVVGLIGRIYEAVEEPDLWPEIIVEMGRFIGCRNDFWSVDPSLPNPDLNPRASEAGCHGTFFL